MITIINIFWLLFYSTMIFSHCDIIFTLCLNIFRISIWLSNKYILICFIFFTLLLFDRSIFFSIIFKTRYIFIISISWRRVLLFKERFILLLFWLLRNFNIISVFAWVINLISFSIVWTIISIVRSCRKAWLCLLFNILWCAQLLLTT